MPAKESDHRSTKKGLTAKVIGIKMPPKSACSQTTSWSGKHHDRGGLGQYNTGRLGSRGRYSRSGLTTSSSKNRRHATSGKTQRPSKVSKGEKDPIRLGTCASGFKEGRLAAPSRRNHVDDPKSGFGRIIDCEQWVPKGGKKWKLCTRGNV